MYEIDEVESPVPDPWVKPKAREGLEWMDRIAPVIGTVILASLAWQVVAVALKIAGVLAWSWWLVFLPILCLAGIFDLACTTIGFLILMDPPKCWMRD